MKRLRGHVLTLSITSFLLNLGWEYAQCSTFFIHGGLKPTHQAMILATLGDVAITWVVYLGFALWRKNYFWVLHSWSKKEIGLITTISLIIAIAIEVRALLTGRWNYTAFNPTLPGLSISVIPLFQLALLVPVSILLTRLLLKRTAR